MQRTWYRLIHAYVCCLSTCEFIHALVMSVLNIFSWCSPFPLALTYFLHPLL